MDSISANSLYEKAVDEVFKRNPKLSKFYGAFLFEGDTNQDGKYSQDEFMKFQQENKILDFASAKNAWVKNALYKYDLSVAKEASKTFYGPLDSVSVKQSYKIGNCYLLASINALSYNSAGRKLLNEAVVLTGIKNGKGVFEVSFKGANEKIQVTEDELENFQNLTYKNGGWINAPIGLTSVQLDVLQIAYAKSEVRKKHLQKYKRSTTAEDYSKLLGGGFSKEIFEILGAKNAQRIYARSEIGKQIVYTKLDEFAQHPEKYIATGYSWHTKQGKTTMAGLDLSVKDAYHAWAIAGVDPINKLVEVRNPWDTDRLRHTFTYEEFAKYFDAFTIASVDEENPQIPEARVA